MVPGQAKGGRSLTTPVRLQLQSTELNLWGIWRLITLLLTHRCRTTSAAYPSTTRAYGSRCNHNQVEHHHYLRGSDLGVEHRSLAAVSNIWNSTLGNPSVAFISDNFTLLANPAGKGIVFYKGKGYKFTARKWNSVSKNNNGPIPLSLVKAPLTAGVATTSTGTLDTKFNVTAPLIARVPISDAGGYLQPLPLPSNNDLNYALSFSADAMVRFYGSNSGKPTLTLTSSSGKTTIAIPVPTQYRYYVLKKGTMHVVCNDGYGGGPNNVCTQCKAGYAGSLLLTSQGCTTCQHDNLFSLAGQSACQSCPLGSKPTQDHSDCVANGLSLVFRITSTQNTLDPFTGGMVRRVLYAAISALLFRSPYTIDNVSLDLLSEDGAVTGRRLGAIDWFVDFLITFAPAGAITLADLALATDANSGYLSRFGAQLGGVGLFGPTGGTVAVQNAVASGTWTTATAIVTPSASCVVDVCYLLDHSGSIQGVLQAWSVEKAVALSSMNGFAVGKIIASMFSDSYDKLAVAAAGDLATVGPALDAQDRTYFGGTAMDSAINGCVASLNAESMFLTVALLCCCVNAATGQASGSTKSRVIVLLTDGQPNSRSATTAAASRAKAAGISIVTVGVAGADIAYMDTLSSGGAGSTISATQFTVTATAETARLALPPKLPCSADAATTNKNVRPPALATRTAATSTPKNCRRVIASQAGGKPPLALYKSACNLDAANQHYSTASASTECGGSGQPIADVLYYGAFVPVVLDAADPSGATAVKQSCGSYDMAKIYYGDGDGWIKVADTIDGAKTPLVTYCDNNPSLADAFLQQAMMEVGWRYAWGGGTKHAHSLSAIENCDGALLDGFDCSSLAHYGVYQGTAGVIDFSPAAARTTAQGIYDSANEYCQKLPYSERQRGDLLFKWTTTDLNTANPKTEITHVAFYWGWVDGVGDVVFDTNCTGCHARMRAMDLSTAPQTYSAGTKQQGFQDHVLRCWDPDGTAAAMTKCVPEDIGGRGTCTDGVWVCKNSWLGGDCSTCVEDLYALIGGTMCNDNETLDRPNCTCVANAAVPGCCNGVSDGRHYILVSYRGYKGFLGFDSPSDIAYCDPNGTTCADSNAGECSLSGTAYDCTDLANCTSGPHYGDDTSDDKDAAAVCNGSEVCCMNRVPTARCFGGSASTYRRSGLCMPAEACTGAGETIELGLCGGPTYCCLGAATMSNPCAAVGLPNWHGLPAVQMTDKAGVTGLRSQANEDSPDMYPFVCAISKAARSQGLDTLDQIAYMLATLKQECSFVPTRERTDRAETDWYHSGIRYYPYYGRGYVQLTWTFNYATYKRVLGCDIVRQPDWVMWPDTALYVMAHGMAHGIFSGKGYKLSDFITTNPDRSQVDQARQTVNANEYLERDSNPAYKTTLNNMNATYEKWAERLKTGAAGAYLRDPANGCLPPVPPPPSE
ncbi:hypothetical protein JKP88DRAFT_248328 [Tribonema minus]|uniref:VWFA domain-containing protein n=1 Tax=Tribonema minus TaxID=303371 RepID=A0A835YPG1_9STRA|nr:hypothetical protein JKP88DRAFT_248328 [Tribonema minus]